MKKNVIEHQRNWHLALPKAIWVDRIEPKASLGKYPLFLVYGQAFVLPNHTLFLSLQLSRFVQDKESLVIQQRLAMLLKLEEERERFENKLIQLQELIKRQFDKNSMGSKYFQ
jgi:hypothetical protein